MAPYCRDPEATGAAGIAGMSGVRSFSEFVIRDKIKLNQMLRMMAVICDVWPPMAMRGSNANVTMRSNHFGYCWRSWQNSIRINDTVAAVDFLGKQTIKCNCADMECD